MRRLVSMMLTGTIINYFFHCQRQCWLFANRINLEDNSEDVRIGRVLHEIKHEREKNTEISIDNIKVDKLTDEYLIEVKKSDADTEAVKWQVLLYLNRLKEKGIERKGRIEYIEQNKQDKKIHYLELSQESEAQLEELAEKINGLISHHSPPESKLMGKCRRCAYYEYCFI